MTAPALARLAALLADDTRATFCLALLDGRAWTAGELAGHAGVAPATATGHLHKLVAAGLLTEQRQGRHRYVRLADARVARLIEELAAHLPPVAVPARTLRAATASAALARGRTCYDHLAGRLGVALTDALERTGRLTRTAGFAFTPAGLTWLNGLGLPNGPAVPAGRDGPGDRDGTNEPGGSNGPGGPDEPGDRHGPDGTDGSNGLGGPDGPGDRDGPGGTGGSNELGGPDELAPVRAGRRPLARGCLDWTERREHLAGAGGAAVCAHLLDQGWVARVGTGRAVRVTPAGSAALADLFGADPAWAA